MDSHQPTSLRTATGDATPAAGIKAPSVAVCIPTFRNQEGLRRLLDSIKSQRFRKVPMPKVEVIVADNDSAGSARGVVEEAERGLSFPLRYCIETKRGIPFARNLLVDCAAGCDLIAFIDDDEHAEPDWLDELLHARQTYAAQVVAGPVLARFAVKPPHWAVAGGFFESARRPTGSPQESFYTGNLLIERMLLAQFSPPFEEAMAVTGGTDSLLAMRIGQTGVRAVWADEAIVHEDVPAKRATMRWYLKRRYRIGNALVLCDRFLPRKHYRVRAILNAMRLTGLGIVVAASALWRGRHKVIRGVGYLCQAAGMVAGAMGRMQNEYGRDDYRRG